MTATRIARSVVVLGAAVLTLSSCAINGLSFRHDERFSWVEPSSGAEVTLPLKLEWTMRDYNGRFAIFVDRSPMSPGDTLLDMVPHADPCRSQPSCPDDEWLANEDIFVTAKSSVVINRVRDGSGERSDRDPKVITIVLLDEHGKRSTESAFVREVTIDRSGTS